MKTSSIIFAIIGILWAIFIPFTLYVTEVAAHGGGHGMPRMLHSMAQDLRAKLPKESASDTALVSLSAQRVSTLAEVLDKIAEDKKADSTGIVGFALFESLIIIILSLFILRTCQRDKNVAA